MRIFLALPAYNEETALPQLFGAFELEMAVAGYSHQVVIVDDGSSDGTCSVIQEWSSRLPIELVRHQANCGLGKTIRDALFRAGALAAPEDVIVTMDADNTHSPALIQRMVGLIEQGSDLVIASRYRSGSRVVGLSAIRHLTSYGARVLFQLLCPLRGVRDYTSGFRAYRASIVQDAFASYGGSFVTEDSFACMAEILFKLSKMTVKMCEVPMILRYDRKSGASKMRIGRTVLKTLKLMIETRLQPRPAVAPRGQPADLRRRQPAPPAR